MPWDRRRHGETERPLAPELRRRSNPATVAKALAPAAAAARGPGRPVRGKKKGRGRTAPGPLPASVTMSVARVLRGEAAPEAGDGGGERWGVLYRLVVRDADGKPIPPDAYTIRRHLLHLSSAGCFAADGKGARISTVALDAESGAFDLVGLPDPALDGHDAPDGEARAAPAGAAREGEERLLEYFSFEMQGVTYAIPQSGFVRARSRRGGRLEVVRTPRASGSVHGAVVPGLLGAGGGDTYVIALRG